MTPKRERELLDRIAKLEQRIRDLEVRPAGTVHHHYYTYYHPAPILPTYPQLPNWPTWTYGEVVS